MTLEETVLAIRLHKLAVALGVFIVSAPAAGQWKAPDRRRWCHSPADLLPETREVPPFQKLQRFQIHNHSNIILAEMSGNIRKK